MFYKSIKTLNLGIAAFLSLVTNFALPLNSFTHAVLAEQVNQADVNYYIQQFNYPYRRLQAIESLARLRKLAVPALIEALKDKNPDIRFCAALTLFSIGWEAKAAVPALITALKDTNVLVRGYAADTLGQIGRDASEALTALISTTKDENAWVRMNAVDALAKLRQEPRLILPVLIEALQDEDNLVRIYAAEGLGEIGEAAKPATIALNKALTDKNIYVAAEAAEALAKIGEANKTSVAVLISALQNRDTRAAATWSLGISGQVAVSSIPYLIEALQNKELFVWSSAADSLSKIAQSFQENPNQLSAQQLDQIISGLEQVLIKIYEENNKFILSVQDVEITLEIMKQERLRRKNLYR